MTAASQPIAQPARYDIGLLFPVLLLVGVGLVMVYSASSALAIKRHSTDIYFLKRQVYYAILGILVLMTCRHIPYTAYRIFAYPALALAAIALAATLFTSYGHSAGGATRWLRIGPLAFQPSEVARLALVVYLAYSMAKKQERIQEFAIGFLPHILAVVLMCGLIAFQPDFGAVVILCMVSGLMMFVGGVRLSHMLGTVALALPIGYVFMISAGYRLRRLVSFLDPWQYATDEGYQAIHSLMAFGSGGIWGTGLGKGMQKLFYLPEPHTDFIFSVIGEELGLLGVLVILGLYGTILWRGVLISRNAPDAFGGLLAAGLTVTLTLQASVNMGVCLGLLPTKGLTLPFLSYGGTSLVMSMAAVGILMNISARQR